MLKYYIAAILLLLLMCIFLFFAVKAMAISTGRKIHNDVNRMLGVYDHLLIKKSNQLAELEKEENELKRLLMYVEPKKERRRIIEFMSGIPHSAVYSPYRNRGFVPVYRKIRSTFGEGHMQEMQKVIQECRYNLQETFIQDAVGQLLSLSFESRYQISVLAVEEQEKIIREIGPEGTSALIRAYKMSMKNFECISFYRWLTERESEVGRQIRIFAARLPKNPQAFGDDVVMYKDESICEGFRIFCGTWFYDFSIGKRELGE